MIPPSSGRPDARGTRRPTGRGGIRRVRCASIDRATRAGQAHAWRTHHKRPSGTLSWCHAGLSKRSCSSEPRKTPPDPPGDPLPERPARRHRRATPDLPTEGVLRRFKILIRMRNSRRHPAAASSRTPSRSGVALIATGACRKRDQTVIQRNPTFFNGPHLHLPHPERAHFAGAPARRTASPSSLGSMAGWDDGLPGAGALPRKPAAAWKQTVRAPETVGQPLEKASPSRPSAMGARRPGRLTRRLPLR